MHRRDFIKVFAGSAVAWPLAARAQQPCKAGNRVPELWLPERRSPPVIEGFRLGLRDLGYVEGTNITIEYRFAEGATSDFLIWRLNWFVPKWT